MSGGPSADTSADMSANDEAVGLHLLAQLPRAERPAALAALVAAEFRTVLQMMPSEALPEDENFFDMGLTSLSVEELKQRLESSLACRIDAEVLFNHPTLAHLLAHLESGPLRDVFDAAKPAGTPAATATPSAADIDRADEKALVDEMLARLYQP